MIDIHAHILPGVDDGPDKIQESILMLDMAYQDGIRALITTPHVSHNCSTQDPERIKESYELLKEKAAEKYPDMKLYLGGELFITHDYLSDIDRLGNELCLHDTDYILIEFDRQVKTSHMLDVIHEIKVRGYTPIIAHIEMYQCLVNHTSIIKEIRRSGAYTQITASSLMGKQGRRISSYLKKLISLGEIDFIATDAHGHMKRRPLLKNALVYVRNIFGESIADKIFLENPAKLLNNEKPEPNPVLPVKTSYIPSLNVTASLAAVILLFIAGMNLYTSEGGAMAQIPPDGGISGASLTLEDADVSKESESEVIMERKEPKTMETDLAGDENISDESGSRYEAFAESTVEGKYIEQLRSLQVNYESELERIVGHINISRTSIEDDQERQRIVEGFIDEIAELESDSDNKVYRLLYEMQNELEKEGRQVASVEKLRKEYFEIKSEKKSYYIDKLDM